MNRVKGCNAILDEELFETYDEELSEIIGNLNRGVVDEEYENNSSFLHYDTGRGRL